VTSATLTRESALAALEAECARQSLSDYAKLVMADDYEQPGQVRMLIDHLEAIERRDITRLIVEMPPRSSKSTHVSRIFPSWWLGRNPQDGVILASYGQELATGHGRAVRDLLGHQRYPFQTRLRADVKAAGRWQTNGGGGLIAAGVGTGLTGFGGVLNVLDDPIKGREEAESEIVREHTWNWYQEVFSTRIQRNGVVVVMGCLSGETLVSLADGSTVPIRDIRRGARVMTYDGDRLIASTVTNWANKGKDYTYKIRTSSGIVVQANASHPWLVQRDGEVSWRRTATLRLGDAILRATGVSGAESPALQTDATPARFVRAFASRTTRKTDTREASARHHTIPSRTVQSTSSTATGSVSRITPVSSTNRAAYAPSAASLRPQKTLILGGAVILPSTTTTTPGAFEGFSATVAISLLGTESPPPSSPQPRDTSDLTPDVILDITGAGIEDVFDIEVEGSETFIANGLLSHNTRWHEDDPIGRILNSAGASQWTRLRVPYLAESGDVLGRPEGEALEVFGQVPSVEKGEISAYGFSALYQQRPTPAGGGVFKTDWMQRRYCAGHPDGGTCPFSAAPLPERTRGRTIQTVDLGGKQGTGHDPSAIATWWSDGISFAVLDYWSSQAEYADIKTKFTEKWWEQRPRSMHVEDATWAQPLISDLRRATGVNVVAQPVEGSKWTRADRVSPIFQSGRVVLPCRAPWLDAWLHEHLSFPNGVHDEAVDTTSMALAELSTYQPPAVGTISGKQRARYAV